MKPRAMSSPLRSPPGHLSGRAGSASQNPDSSPRPAASQPSRAAERAFAAPEGLHYTLPAPKLLGLKGFAETAPLFGGRAVVGCDDARQEHQASQARPH